MLHHEILNDAQKNLLPLVSVFQKDFGLVGGTAVALQIGHRESIDFDLFSLKALDRNSIRKHITHFSVLSHIFVDNADEYTILVDGVKCTFLTYPFTIDFSVAFDDIIRLPDLLTLSAMKAYALGRRAKWKDYVDLFFIMKDYHSLSEIVTKTKEIFGDEFNEKIFRTQLAYFNDIDYSEKIIWMPGFETDEDVVKETLTRLSLG